MRQRTSNAAPNDRNSENREMTNSRTTPKETGKGDWKMPEPVFRVSDGYCPLTPSTSTQSAEAVDLPKQPPERIAEKLSNSNAPTDSTDSEENLPDITLMNMSLSDLKAPASDEDKDSAINTQQPSPTSEQIAAESAKSETPSENRSKTKAVYVFFAVLGILAMIFLTAAILIIAYFWFFYRTTAG